MMSMWVENSKELKYRVYKDGTAAVVGLLGHDIECITILSVIEHEGKEYPVTKIKKDAFSDSKKLTSVELSEGLLEIEDGAFRGCGELKSIVVPQSLKLIGDGAFRSCSKLHDIIYLGSLETWCSLENGQYIGEYYHLWINGKEVTTFVVPDDWTSLKSVMYQCVGLTSATINNNITKIDEFALWGCRGLTEIDLPESIVKIERCAFDYCESIDTIALPDGITKIEEDTSSWCTSLKSIDLSKNITRIKERAFSDCTALESISLPERVSKIDRQAFYGCKKLTAVDFKESFKVGWEAFSGCRSCVP